MANPFDIAIPSLLGNVSQGGQSFAENMVKAQQMKQQMSQQALDQLLKTQPQFHSLGTGHGIIFDPMKGQVTDQFMVPDPYRQAQAWIAGQNALANRDRAEAALQRADDLGKYNEAMAKINQQLANIKGMPPPPYPKSPFERVYDKVEKFGYDKLGLKEKEVFDAGVAGLGGTAAKPEKAPPGYRYIKGSGELEAIPGGPADVKAKGKFDADTKVLEYTTSTLDELAKTANELLNHPGLAGIVGVRGALPNFWGSSAADAEAILNTLRAKVGFGALQAMRDASKTGGALGNVTEPEHKLLQNQLAPIEKPQSFEQMQKSLRDIIQYTELAKGRIYNAYNLKYAEGQARPRPLVPPAPQKPTVQTAPSQPSQGWSIRKLE